ncbi:hypothetical protein BDZ97DRAFT_1776200 [Flammula alnicola]|nr:hypothetical protein BDZ97DRAFT_1776200 [Flammula alnicola]
MTSGDNKIFNVEEVSGKRHSALDTTVVEARLDAPNPHIAYQVGENAEKEHEAAKQVASVAKMMGPKLTGEPATASDKVRDDKVRDEASRTMDAAVEEGKRDIDSAKAAGAAYVEQVKALANSAIETAQAYLPASVGGKPTETTQGTQGSSHPTPASSKDIPATSAPLESGPHTVDTPYPPTK